MKKLISILIPAYNEAPVLPALLARINALADTQKKYDFEFLFVNDGSSDETLALIKQEAAHNPRVSYVDFSRNFGKEIAMIAGLDHVRGDAVVIIDADLQDPPELIPDMIAAWRDGFDDVYARRRSRAGESWLKRTTSSAYYRLLQRLTRVPIQRDTGDFRLLDRRVVEALTKFRATNRNAKALFSLVGFAKKELLYDRDPRAAGTTKWSYPKLVGLAVDGILSFTTAPLRITTFVGLLVSAAAFVFLIVILTRTIFFGADVAGYPSIMATVLFLGGVQLLSLGIIGECVGRIFNETKGHPLYITNEVYRGDTTKKD